MRWDSCVPRTRALRNELACWRVWWRKRWICVMGCASKPAFHIYLAGLWVQMTFEAWRMAWEIAYT